jgi:hypothetical protein
MYNPQAWADHWDKNNPSKFKQSCDQSRVLQEEYQKEREKKLKELQQINELLSKEKK